MSMLHFCWELCLSHMHKTQMCKVHDTGLTKTNTSILSYVKSKESVFPGTHISAFICVHVRTLLVFERHCGFCLPCQSASLPNNLMESLCSRNLVCKCRCLISEVSRYVWSPSYCHDSPQSDRTELSLDFTDQSLCSYIPNYTAVLLPCYPLLLPYITSS